MFGLYLVFATAIWCVGLPVWIAYVCSIRCRCYLHMLLDIVVVVGCKHADQCSMRISAVSSTVRMVLD